MGGAGAARSNHLPVSFLLRRPRFAAPVFLPSFAFPALSPGCSVLGAAGSATAANAALRGRPAPAPSSSLRSEAAAVRRWRQLPLLHSEQRGGAGHELLWSGKEQGEKENARTR